MSSFNDMKEFVNNALTNKENGTEFPFVIINKCTDNIIGSTRFMEISQATKTLEIGWTWIEPSNWSTGLNMECKYLMLKYCFETLGFVKVQFKTDERNGRSQKALEKIGAIRTGLRKNHMLRKDGTLRSSVFYSISESDWESVKRNLEEKLT
ncbi:GNAT family protein [Gracilibacillus halotolerans]|uniref:GNAT family N-acetyltransferase n=1 Tax=Gracilibacillus halotolerans TaxID=74386 RepID=UPI0031B62FEF